MMMQAGQMMMTTMMTMTLSKPRQGNDEARMLLLRSTIKSLIVWQGSGLKSLLPVRKECQDHREAKFLNSLKLK